jgi:hypothetical protein
MDDERPNLPPAARDIAGAWVVCALIAVLALALSSPLQGHMPPAATMAAKPSPCGSDLRSGCSAATKAAAKLNTIAGLHRLSVPEVRTGDRHPG